MLNGAGEFADPDPAAGQTDERGIPYYQKSLDLLANEFARVMNEANVIRDENGLITGGGILFDAGDGSNKWGEIIDGNNNRVVITAANISISDAWSTGDTKLLCSRKDDAASGATDNLTHILAELTSKDHKFYTEALRDPAFDPENPPANTTPIFTGSLQDMFLNIESVLGNDISSTTVVLTSYATTADGLYMDRDAVSGVDLNEEAANMMQYQKAYSAACRLMTTLDQALDKLINGTGVVGL